MKKASAFALAPINAAITTSRRSPNTRDIVVMVPTTALDRSRPGPVCTGLFALPSAICSQVPAKSLSTSAPAMIHREYAATAMQSMYAHWESGFQRAFLKHPYDPLNAPEYLHLRPVIHAARQ